MSADREFDVKITTSADLSALTSARAGLEELKRQAVAMGVSTGDLDKQIASLDANMLRLGKSGSGSIPQTAEEVELLNTHCREFRRLAGEIDRFVPGIGEVLIGAFNPEVLGIAALVAAIEFLSKLFHKLSQDAAELKTQLDAVNSATIDGLVAATNAAAASARDYNETLDRTPSAQDKIKQGESEQLTIIRNKAEAQQKLLEAQEKLALAMAAGDPIKQAQIREAFGEKKGKAALDAEAAAVLAEQMQAEGHMGMSGPLRKRMDAAKAAHDAAVKNQTENEPILKDDEAYYRKQIGDLSEKERQAFGTPGHQAALDELNRARYNLGATLNTENTNKDAVDTTEGAFKKAKTAWETNETAIDELSATAKQAAAALKIKITTLNAITPLAKETNLIDQIHAAIQAHAQQGENMGGYIDQLGKITTNSHTTIMRKIQQLETRLNSIIHNGGAP